MCHYNNNNAYQQYKVALNLFIGCISPYVIWVYPCTLGNITIYPCQCVGLFTVHFFLGGGPIYYPSQQPVPRTSSRLVCVFRNFPLNTEKLPASIHKTSLGKAGPKGPGVQDDRDGFRLQVVESTSCRLIFVVDLQFMATIGNVGIVFWVCFCNNHLLKVVSKFIEICKYSTTVGGIRTPKNITQKTKSSAVIWKTIGLLYVVFPIWMFPKIVGFPPKSSIIIGFSIIFTIPFGVPLIFGNTHIG